MKTNFLHAYKQAPWRTQLQWIGVFLLILVIIAAIAGVYLSISARAATAGRNIQNLDQDVTQLEIDINDLTSQIASVTSYQTMQERVKALDMEPIDPQQALYLEIPGYTPKASVILAPPARAESSDAPILLPEFTSSLWDWLTSQLHPAVSPSEVQP